MADMQSHIEYSLADIERYLSNRMSAQERHAMEKAALQDPFLADAIEGYSETSFSVAQEHLNQITAAITGQQQEDAKVVPMAAAKPFPFVRAIAAVFILVVAGLATWGLLKKSDTPITAATQPEQKGKAHEEVSAAGNQNGLTKSADNEKTVTPAIELPKLSQQTTTKETTPVPIHSAMAQAATLDYDEAYRKDSFVKQQAYAGDVYYNKEMAAVKAADSALYAKNEVAVVANTDNRMRKSLSTASAAQSNWASTPGPVNVDKALEGKTAGIATTPGKLKSNLSNNSFNGRIVNNNGEPLSFATVNINAANNKRYAAVSDDKGYFNIQSTDTVINADIASIGYQQQNVNLLANTSNTVVLQQGANSLAEEVLVIGYGTRKKAISHTDSSTVHPAGGWNQFLEYVSKKKDALKDTADEEDYADNGSVDMEFEIDRRGKPVNISIIRSDAEALSKKAIQIVKEGPAWITEKKKKKAKITIQF